MPRSATIAHSHPDLGEAEVRAVARVIRSRQVAGGREVERLEREFAARFGFRHAVALSSGTAALHLALIALGVRRGQRVVTPSYVCTAVLNSIRYTGARERLVDVEPGGVNLDAMAAATLAAAVAIVPHLFGHPADAATVARGGTPVIEDCAMALGARTATGEQVGHVGQAAVYSFYATKTLAAGEGGLLSTDDDALAAEIRDLRSYDKCPDWKLRYNYKLTDMQAALLRPQLRRLDRALERRRRIAKRYLERLAASPLTLPRDAPGDSWYRFVVRVPGGFERARRRFAAAGVTIARPVHRPLHSYLELPAARFPHTEVLHASAVSLPIYPSLSSDEVDRVVAAALKL